MIAYIIPTRDRPEELRKTLDAIGRLGCPIGLGGAEVVVVDNASSTPVEVPETLASGVSVRVIRSEENLGAAARNLGARSTSERCTWLVMLDDDSAPLDSSFEIAIRRAGPEVGAISADIFLGEHEEKIERREDGGLPEVFVGCGALIRRDVFLDLGGYDETFGFYAEEYDFCARLLRSGRQVRHSPIFRVLHRKVEAQRDMDLIVRRLVRNNAWVCERYAPMACVDEEIERVKERCREIAEREGALRGYDLGMADLEATLGEQRRTPMDAAMWERFTGLAHAREAIAARLPEGAASAEIVAPGKNAHVIRRAMRDLSIEEVSRGGDVRIIGTMSPGPMLDALERLGTGSGVPMIAPWLGAKPASVFHWNPSASAA